MFDKNCSLIILFLFVCVTFTSAQFSDCKLSNVFGSVTSLNVSGCVSNRCPLSRGKNHSIAIKFIPNEATDKPIEVLTIGIIQFIPGGKPSSVTWSKIPGFNVTHKVSDNSQLGIGNGIEANVEYIHNAVFKVPNFAPPNTNVTIQYLFREKSKSKRVRLETDKEKKFACKEILARIV